jgi:hypothetical protein
LVRVFFFSFKASIVLALVDAFLAAGFSGATPLSSTTFLGLPRFLTAGGSTVAVADVAAAIVIWFECR